MTSYGTMLTKVCWPLCFAVSGRPQRLRWGTRWPWTTDQICGKECGLEFSFRAKDTYERL